MANKVFCDISISADGYVAGPGQTAEKPFGDGPVDRLHAWMFDTPDENRAEIDQVVAAGAFVMGLMAVSLPLSYASGPCGKPRTS
jgi:hypothetical protein